MSIDREIIVDTGKKEAMTVICIPNYVIRWPFEKQCIVYYAITSIHVINAAKDFLTAWEIDQKTLRNDDSLM